LVGKWLVRSKEKKTKRARLSFLFSEFEIGKDYLSLFNFPLILGLKKLEIDKIFYFETLRRGNALGKKRKWRGL